MRSILNRNLITPIILAGFVSLATVQPVAAQQQAGWVLQQDSNLIFCQGSSRTSCNPGLGQILPTVAGSIWILQSQSPNNVSISSINPGNGGGTWIHCAACHVTNPSGLTADVWYNLTGSAGFVMGSGFGFTLSGNAGNFFGANFIEISPPAGSIASLDTQATATPIGCSACTGPTLTTTATDAIWMNPGGGPDIDWNSSSAPFFTDFNGGIVGLNIAPGTITINKKFATPPLQNPELVAMAFKSTAGVFSRPTSQYTLVNSKAFVPTTACSTCNVPIPATTGGNLLYLEAANEVGSFISSVSGGGAWTVPTAAAPNGCRGSQVVQTTNNTLSCAYLLSTTGGVTSLSVTMAGGAAAHGFYVAEISSSNGPFALDAIGITFNTPNATCSGFCYPGQPLTITGKNDVIFQASWDVGESEGSSVFTQPLIPTTSQGAQGPGPANTFAFQNASIGVLTDSGPTAPTPQWLNAVQNQNTFVTGVAFKTSGGSTAPNPPSG